MHAFKDIMQEPKLNFSADPRRVLVHDIQHFLAAYETLVLTYVQRDVYLIVRALDSLTKC